ncbi:hypothetical protein DYQ86_05505 [Acidobacteria bacterium AB60]|nr:hypothetical protein DYQ86_05505 [Acidobacteria bacterium AB60]
MAATNPGGHGTTDTDVLIVGAGPVGLFLANECARRGMRYRVIEMRAGQSEYSKALAIFPRTLEVFNMSGLVQPFLRIGNRVDSVAFMTREETLARMAFEPEGTPYPFVAMVPQDVTEKILVAELRRRGGEVEYETTFISAAEHDGYVSATLERRGERVQVTAKFLVGCDGAHSAVRHLLHLPFEGGQYDGAFMLADVDTNEVLPANELHLCPSEFGPLAIFPMSATRRRLVATVDVMGDGAPSLELVREVVAQRAPAGFEAQGLHWSSYFRIHHRHVGRMHVGRIFIAGDAAHIHSPFGGQGMNTGLQDVWNLCWKLQLAVSGRGSQELLESYSAERCPVIKGVIETTHRITQAMGTKSSLAQAIRRTVIPLLSHVSAFERGFVENLSELGIAYSGSPIVEGGGARFWDDSLGGGQNIKDRFLLFVPLDANDSIRKRAAAFRDSFPDLLELRYARTVHLTLVRPDGYTACGGKASDSARVLESMYQLMTRQARS